MTRKRACEHQCGSRLGLSGMVNKCELSVNRRQLQQAKDVDRLEPKGTWSVQGLKLSLSWTNDHRRIERAFPTLADKRNTVSPYRSLWEDKSQGKSTAVRVEDERESQRRSVIERIGVEPSATSLHAKAGRLLSGLSSRENPANRLRGKSG
jgi:hypothetical protein